MCTATIYIYIFQEMEKDDDVWTEFHEVEVCDIIYIYIYTKGTGLSVKGAQHTKRGRH